MKKNILILSIIVGAILLCVGFFIFANKGQEKGIDDSQIVDCGELQNPVCFESRMTECLPVTAKLTGTDGSDIDITILGYENDKCHFQRKISGIVSLDCYFPKQISLNWDLIDQTFGNEKGLQQIVDENC